MVDGRLVIEQFEARGWQVTVRRLPLDCFKVEPEAITTQLKIRSRFRCKDDPTVEVSRDEDTSYLPLLLPTKLSHVG